MQNEYIIVFNCEKTNQNLRKMYFYENYQRTVWANGGKARVRSKAILQIIGFMDNLEGQPASSRQVPFGDYTLHWK